MKPIEGGADARRLQHDAAIRGAGLMGPTLSDRFIIIEWDGGARSSLIIAPAEQASVDFHRHMTDVTGFGDAQQWPRCFCRIITIKGELVGIGHETREGAWFFLTDIEGVRHVKIS